MIAPIAFIVSLFQPSVRMYEMKNTGWKYDLGFLRLVVPNAQPEPAHAKT